MPNTLTDWATRHNINSVALKDLIDTLTVAPSPIKGPTLKTEAEAQANCRLEASRQGARLWRNNNGVVQDAKGNVFRYGLCNDSKAVNATLKSSDLIGLSKTGQFIAREVKRPGWIYRGTDREKAQLNFIILVNKLGGNAQFSTGGY